MSTGPRDVVIVGGGIVGCLSGYLLAKEGVKATVVEADSLGSHASGFAFGGLDPLHGAGLPEPLLDFSLWCYGRHQSLAQELQEATSAEVHFEAQDRLYLCFDDAEAQTAKKGLEWMQGLSGFSCQWLDEKASLEAEPLINPDCIGTVHQQGAGSVEPYRLVLAAVGAGERFGMEMLHRRAIGLESDGSRCAGVTLQNGRIEAGAVVLAMGPWTGEASRWCGADIPVSPLKGEILRLRSGRGQLRVGLNYRGNYAATKPDGLIWAGTTEEEAGFDDHPSPAARDSITGDLLKMSPGLSGAELVQHTACLRPVTPDGMPIVARAPGWDNLYVATGAGRKGILWSTGMAQIVADLVTKGETTVPGEEHLELSRFRSAA